MFTRARQDRQSLCIVNTTKKQNDLPGKSHVSASKRVETRVLASEQLPTRVFGSYADAKILNFMGSVPRLNSMRKCQKLREFARSTMVEQQEIIRSATKLNFAGACRLVKNQDAKALEYMRRSHMWSEPSTTRGICHFCVISSACSRYASESFDSETQTQIQHFKPFLDLKFL